MVTLEYLSKMKACFVLLCSVVLASTGFSQSVFAEVFESKPTKVSVIELYTSEGCSSCPPADAWLSNLKDKKGLWQDYVPLAFHVTYWDYIGWKDRLGSKAFANRQRNYAAAWRASTVYTPGFVLNGREFRYWGPGRSVPEIDQTASGILRLEHLGDDEYEVSYQPMSNTTKVWIGNVALLGFGIESKISAGENSGRKLTHDFAVLEHKQLVLNPNDQGRLAARIKMHRDNRLEPTRFGVAAWVHDQRSLEPIQATGGYLS